MKRKGYQRPCLIFFFLETSQTQGTTYLAPSAGILLIYTCLPYFNAKNEKYTSFQKIYSRIHRLLKELGSLNNNLIMLELWKKNYTSFETFY